MRNKFILSAALAPAAVVMGMAIASPAMADADDLIPLDECLEAAQDIHMGEFVKVEYLSVSPAGVPTYEIEIRDDNDVEWEMMCNARTGDIYELETEVDSAQDEAFAKNAKITEDDAIKTVTARFGGEVVEVEYEIETDGSPTYEIDVSRDGQENEFKVEVDAVTGDIIELSVEEWQIGQEPSEEVGDNAQSGRSSNSSGT